MPEATKAAIDDFLQQKRIAIAGVSRQPQSFSRMMFREFLHRGYDVIPVNPHATELECVTANARIADIQPPPTAVLVMTSPERVDEVVRDCAAAGVKRVWLYRGIASSGLSGDAQVLCKQSGIALIAGECPFMHLANTGLVHKIHRFFRQVAGTLPK